jgi:hypothetical protein
MIYINTKVTGLVHVIITIQVLFNLTAADFQNFSNKIGLQASSNLNSYNPATIHFRIFYLISRSKTQKLKYTML